MNADQTLELVRLAIKGGIDERTGRLWNVEARTDGHYEGFDHPYMLKFSFKSDAYDREVWIEGKQWKWHKVFMRDDVDLLEFASGEAERAVHVLEMITKGEK
jgi:hypothetical protein